MDEKYKGMTVNERLWVSGLMDDFDKAVKSKDVQKAQEILEKVELTEPNIIAILQQKRLVPREEN